MLICADVAVNYADVNFNDAVVAVNDADANVNDADVDAKSMRVRAAVILNKWWPCSLEQTNKNNKQ